jgi:hypothetical protein
MLSNMIVSLGLVQYVYIFVGASALLLTVAGWFFGAHHQKKRAKPVTLQDGLVGAIFGLSALALGFTFANASSGFTVREEGNRTEASAIKALYNSAKYLEPADQEHLKKSLLQLLDLRVNGYFNISSLAEVDPVIEKINSSIIKINEDTVIAAQKTTATNQLLVDQILKPQLATLTSTFTTSTIKVTRHPPKLVTTFLFILLMIGSVLTGYSMAVKNETNWTLSTLYAFLISFTFYVILSLEYPNIFMEPQEFNRDLLKVMDFFTQSALKN